MLHEFLAKNHPQKHFFFGNALGPGMGVFLQSALSAFVSTLILCQGFCGVESSVNMDSINMNHKKKKSGSSHR